jgi:site-specific recombinase XerD
MQTTIKLIFRATHRKGGKGSLFWQITRHRETRKIATFYELSYSEWDEYRQRILSPANVSPQRRKELSALHRKLKKDLRQLSFLQEILESRGDYSAQDFVNFYRRQQQGQPFCRFIRQITERLNEEEKFGTAHAYQYAAVSFLKFRSGVDIAVDKITSCLMKEYEYYLKTKNKSLNTISCYVRSLRAAYNQAIRERVFIPQTPAKPFAGVFTGNARTVKRGMNSAAILKLKEMRLQEQTAEKADRLTMSRDFFLFSFYTQGMSFSDMANLKPENIRDGFIRYYRKKTGQEITIQMEDCIRRIVERYSEPDSGFIFPVLRAYKDCDELVKWKKTGAALSVFNRNLNKLARMAGLENHLTSYVSRHSWASIASQEGIPLSTISRGMGHQSEKTTQIYISRLDFSDVGKANKIILSLFTG